MKYSQPTVLNVPIQPFDTNCPSGMTFSCTTFTCSGYFNCGASSWDRSKCKTYKVTS